MHNHAHLTITCIAPKLLEDFKAVCKEQGIPAKDKILLLMLREVKDKTK